MYTHCSLLQKRLGNFGHHVHDMFRFAVMMTTRGLCQSWISSLLIATSGRRLIPLYLLAVGLMCLLLLQVRQIKNRFGGSNDESIGVGGTFETCKPVDGVKDETSPLLFVYWTSVFLKKDWGFGAHLEQCPRLKEKCIFSTNQSLHCSADVMLLHMRDPFEVTLHRPPHQKWVFGIMESPVYTDVNLNAIRLLFNVTMTYKRTSNIPWLYGRCIPLPPHDVNTTPAATNFAAGKMHIAAWFVSNCNPQSRRQMYVERLMVYMDVHVYGQCGGAYDCPKQDEELCMARVNDEYKFIFAFENSLCEDYVTEKVWQIMQRQLNVVLVVLGHTRYAEILPSHSFIDVSDYSSPESLAKYLMRLDADDALYNEYFRWKASYDCTGNGPPMGCQLCDYMLQHRGEQQTVDVQQFWSFETNCIQPERFYAGWQQISARASAVIILSTLL